MKIGFMGLGKLGLPVALAVESKGHEVFGYDISQKTIDNIKKKKIDYKEIWVEDYLPNSKLKVVDVLTFNQDGLIKSIRAYQG